MTLRKWDDSRIKLWLFYNRSIQDGSLQEACDIIEELLPPESRVINDRNAYEEKLNSAIKY